MNDNEQDDLFGNLPPVKPLSPTQQRLIKSSVLIEADQPDSILYQHTVFCQTGLPYRGPGDDARVWERTNGTAHLKIIAGKRCTQSRAVLSRLACHSDPNPG
jgi:hypothetical protein